MPKLTSRAKNQKNQIVKNIITKLIPTDWDELAWDVGEWIAEEIAGNAIEQAMNGEEEMVSTTVQNNYVYNTYVTQKTNVNNPVVPQTFPPRFNYQSPPRIFRSPPQINLPEPILPTDIDNQTATKTPVGASINVGASVQNDRYKMGKCIFHPASTQKTGIRRKVPKNFLVFEYHKAQKEAIGIISKLKNGESTPIEYSGWLVASSNLAGLKGDGHILFGINSLSALAQTYRALSSIATLEPTNEIPVKYENIDIDDKFTALKFNGKSESLPSNNLATKLGYEEKDFEEKTIEDIIKDYGKKQYEISTQSLLQKLKNWFNTGQAQITINPIKDLKIENSDQFAIHLLASQFFRSGYHRLPAKLPESLLFDTDKYKKFTDQPTILIDDNLEFSEYLLKNLDGILGQFPLNLKYKTADANGSIQEKTINIPNIAECLAEILGSNLAIQSDANTSLVIGMKGLAESAKAGNAATLAADIARANAEYLGYKSREVKKEIPYSFTPGQYNIRDALKNSIQKMVSFENVDDEQLVDDIKLILIAAQIIKGALVQPYKEGGKITGDGIRETQRAYQEKYDKEWKDYLDSYNSNNATKPFKKAKIKNKPPGFKNIT